MLLSETIFNGVVKSLGGDPALVVGGQRRGPRAALDARLTIIPYPDGTRGVPGDPLSVPVRNFSRGGMRFLLPRRLPLDTPFVAMLPRVAETGQAPLAPLPAVGIIAYWQPIERDLFALGARFTGILSDYRAPVAEPRIVLFGQVAAERAGQNMARNAI
jgi:hypothetical protein